MGNQLLDKPHHETPRGLKFDLVAESPLIMIMFNALSRQIYQRYPQATIKVRSWDYDSLDAIIRGEVDIGFTGRESHPRSRELLSLLPLSIDYEVLFTDLPWVWLREDHPALQEEWNLETFLRYPHISICWEQSDTWALDDVLQEMGRERNIALSLPGSNSRCLWPLSRITPCWPPRHATASIIISSTSYLWWPALCLSMLRNGTNCRCRLPYSGINEIVTTRK